MIGKFAQFAVGAVVLGLGGYAIATKLNERAKEPVFTGPTPGEKACPDFYEQFYDEKLAKEGTGCPVDHPDPSDVAPEEPVDAEFTPIEVDCSEFYGQIFGDGTPAKEETGPSGVVPEEDNSPAIDPDEIESKEDEVMPESTVAPMEEDVTVVTADGDADQEINEALIAEADAASEPVSEGDIFREVGAPTIDEDAGGERI